MSKSKEKSDELLIRRLVPDDLEDILRIERASFSAPWSRESYERELSANPLAYYLGCFLAGRLAGYAGFWLILDEGHIANVAVDPDCRGRGVGGFLLENLISLCFVSGGRWMTLEVRVSNLAAQGLYHKLGFVDLGRRPGYYGDGEDAIIMWKDLRSF
ncbi:MAG: ribosomal protein S18-alanine N-acetyltransferase [Clostridiales bacterium]|nr:ribosomal protein S18-alanine N-acetyltransferase [Clostridiales bacterium]